LFFVFVALYIEILVQKLDICSAAKFVYSLQKSNARGRLTSKIVIGQLWSCDLLDLSKIRLSKISKDRTKIDNSNSNSQS